MSLKSELCLKDDLFDNFACFRPQAASSESKPNVQEPSSKAEDPGPSQAKLSQSHNLKFSCNITAKVNFIFSCDGAAQQVHFSLCLSVCGPKLTEFLPVYICLHAFT